MWRAITIVAVSVFLAAMTCDSEPSGGEAEEEAPTQSTRTLEFRTKLKFAAADSVQYDDYGEELASDGKHLIVGASRNDQRGGAAYVYTLGPDGPDGEIPLVPGDRTKRDHFGSDVDVSGDHAIVGASHHDPLDSRLNNQKYGGAYFFARSGGGWVQEGFVQASDRELNHEFGGAVAISGESAVIGAIYSDVGDNPDQGQAYVFSLGDSGWTETQILAAPDGQATDYFGSKVEIDGDTIFISSPQHRGGEFDHALGAVWVYERGGDGQWTLQGKLQPDDLEDGNNFGSSIHIAGDVAIVGAHLAHGAETGTGTAYVFRRGSDGWRQEARLMASSGGLGDDFGHRVAIEGDRALVGAWFTGLGEELHRGAAYVFEGGPDGWREVARLTASDGGYQDQFGSAVALAPGHLIIGASGEDENVGAVYVFE